MRKVDDAWYESAKAVLAKHFTVVDASEEIGSTPHVLKERFARRGMSASSFLAKVGKNRATKRSEARLAHLKEVLGRYDSLKAVAREVGIGSNLISTAFYNAGIRASDYLLKPPLPTDEPLGRLDQRLKGISSKRGPGGKILEEWTKTERATTDEGQAAGEVPPGFLVKKVSVATDSTGSTRLVWKQYFQEEKAKWDAFWLAARESAREYAGLAKPTRAPKLAARSSRLLDVYAVGDLHVGMYAWAAETGASFDLKIVESDLLTMVDVLADRSPPSKRATLLNVGDYFHSQGNKQVTPGSEHKLDVDGRHGKVLRVGLNILRRATDRLLEKHDVVDLVNLPGNHDPEISLVIPIWLEEVYKNEPRVRILQNLNPYCYDRHGTCLLGYCHGDGPKLEQLPLVMAHDRREDWGQTEHHQWITGHIHQDAEREFPGCLVTTVRTTSPRDYWAHWKGFRSSQGMTTFVFDEEGGEVDRVKSTMKYARTLRLSA